MKMTNEIRIKMAECEGMYRADIPIIHAVYGGPDIVAGYRCSRVDEVPTYADDNDLDRFIRGMDGIQIGKYRYELILVVTRRGVTRPLWDELLQAPAEQKQEAIVKAMGWEDETDGE